MLSIYNSTECTATSKTIRPLPKSHQDCYAHRHGEKQLDDFLNHIKTAMHIDMET